MALWVCRRCGCKFAVGLAMCPQCTGTDVEEDSELAKITLSGPSDAAADAENAQAVDKPVDDKEAKSSAGISSSTPTDSPQTEASEETTSKPKSAQTTESHSKKGQTASSTARTTGTSRTKQ